MAGCFVYVFKYSVGHKYHMRDHWFQKVTIKGKKTTQMIGLLHIGPIPSTWENFMENGQ